MPSLESDPRGRRALFVGLTVLFGVSAGCGTVKTSGTARTGTEQLLLTSAWDAALRKVDFRPLTGVPVYLDTTNVAAVDQGWVVSSLRQALLENGAMVRPKPEQAEWIVEARVGAFGTDDSNWLLGIPQTTIPPTVTGVPTGTIPELPLVKKSHQEGVAKLALFAYDRASGQLVWRSGTMLAKSSARDMYIGGVGPIQSGSIHDGTEFAGLPLPPAIDPNRPASPSKRRRGLFRKTPQPRESEPQAVRIPAGRSDFDDFGP